MSIAAIEHVVVIVVITDNQVGNLAADRFWTVSTVPVQWAALVGRLEIFEDGPSHILLARCAVLVLQSPKTVPSITLAYAGTIFKDVVEIDLQLVLFVDVPAKLGCQDADVVAIDPVFRCIVVLIVTVA